MKKLILLLSIVLGSLLGFSQNSVMKYQAATSDTFVATSLSSPTAYTNALVASNKPANLYGLTGYNSNTSAYWVQIFNKTTIPNDGSVPIIIIYVPGSSAFSYNTGDFPIAFSNGIVWCTSTTAATKTIGSSSDTWVNLSYK